MGGQLSGTLQAWPLAVKRVLAAITGIHLTESIDLEFLCSMNYCRLCVFPLRTVEQNGACAQRPG